MSDQTEIVLIKRYYWVTPKGTFNKPTIAGEANNCSDLMIKYRCNKKRDGYYKVIERLSSLKCKHCGLTRKCTLENFRMDKKKGKYYPSRVCRSCITRRDRIKKSSTPHLYKFYIKDELVYVGRTKQLTRRFQRHFKGDNYEPWKDEVDRIEVCELGSESDMNVLEIYLINLLKPKFNKSNTTTDLPTFKINIPQFKEYKQ